MANPNRKRLVLPTTLEPNTFREFCITIPDDETHIAAFWGALQLLANRRTWGKPLSNDSETVAFYWQELLIANRRCFDMNLNCGCCPEPTNRRITPDFRIEQSFDNGITWEVDDTDPRFNSILFPSIPIAAGSKCDAAHTARVTLKEAFDELLTNLDIWTAVTAFVTTVCGWLIRVFPVPGIACVIISAVAASILAIGRSVIEAAMTTAVYDALECIIFCHIQDDGQVTDSGWDAIRQDILDSSDFDTASETFLWNMLTILGPDGLTNAARTIPTLTGDCSGCPGCEPCTEITIEHGTLIDEPEPGVFVVNSALTETNQHAIIINFGGTSADCCYADDIQITGFAPFEQYWLCGEANPVGNLNQSRCIWRMWRNTGVGGAAFTLTLTMSCQSGCGDCP